MMKLRMPNEIQDKLYLLPYGVIIVFVAISAFFYSQHVQSMKKQADLSVQLIKTKKDLDQSVKELTDLKNQDQYKINKALEKEIADIQNTYQDAVTAYEQLVDLKSQTAKTGKMDEEFAGILSLLSKRNYASASANLTSLKNEIQNTKDSLASVTIPASVAVNNTPPSSGYSRQSVASDVGIFMVDIITADLNSAKVIVDTASNGDCGNNCPVDSLGN